MFFFILVVVGSLLVLILKTNTIIKNQIIQGDGKKAVNILV